MKMEFAHVRKILEVTSVHCVDWDIMDCQIVLMVNLYLQDSWKCNKNISISEYPNVIVTTGKKGVDIVLDLSVAVTSTEVIDVPGRCISSSSSFDYPKE